MIRRMLTRIGLVLIVLSPWAFAGEHYLLRVPSAKIGDVAARHGLKVVREIGSANDLFRVKFNGAPSGAALDALSRDPAVEDLEEDGQLALPEIAGGVRTELAGQELKGFEKPAVARLFGADVLAAYVNQPAALVIALDAARSFATGAGTVAILDTGADINHPALKGSLVEGYDFTRNAAGGSELADLDQSTTAILDQLQSTTAILDKTRLVTLNQSTTAILDQSTTAILDRLKLPGAFGHGTMVAGVVHLVAPTAKIMPVKVFSGDGFSTISRIVDGIYYAVQHGATVINMSFSSGEPSKELRKAIKYATSRGVICIASAGNDGERTMVYPAGYGIVGVGSTSNLLQRSSFSNYGDRLVTVAAPGEGVVTLYPGNNYALAWGTSFSAPFVAGGAALVAQLEGGANQSQAERALSRALPLPGLELGAGELNLAMACVYAFPRRN
jgi:subtilisin family serine protease